MAGLSITYMRPFKKGDRIKIGKTTGVVVEKSLLATKIRTFQSEDVTIPNSIILRDQTFNYSTQNINQGLKLSVDVSFDLADDKNKIEGVLLKSAKSAEHVINSPEPYVILTSYWEEGVYFELNFFIDNPDKSDLAISELCQLILENSNENNLICKTVVGSDI